MRWPSRVNVWWWYVFVCKILIFLVDRFGRILYLDSALLLIFIDPTMDHSKMLTHNNAGVQRS